MENASPARRRSEIAAQGHYHRKLRDRESHPYLLGRALQGRRRPGGGCAFRRGAGGAEPARRAIGRSAAASRGALGLRENWAGAPSRYLKSGQVRLLASLTSARAPLLG